MQQRLLRFVADLRIHRLSVSVAESLDAARAVALVGVDRSVLRDALAACLIKDEADREIFEALFDVHFPLLAPRAAGKRPGRGRGVGGAGTPDDGGRTGSGAGSGAGCDPGTTTVSPVSPGGVSRAAPVPRAMPAISPGGRNEGRSSAARFPRDPARRQPVSAPDAHGRERRGTGPSRAPREIVRRPFHELAAVEVDAVREVVAVLAHRLRRRLARRLRRTRRGRVDLRRTLRRATATGGVPVRLVSRARRPDRPDLVALCDISGSVAIASELLLGLIAPAAEFFRSVSTYVYVDHLHEASFEDGFLVHAPELDRHAYSDFGQVLGEYLAGPGRHLGRSTVVVVLGDARNNRRPAHARRLAEIRSRVRAVVWLSPEPTSRWNTGDSAIGQYAPHCDAVLECVDVDALVAALGRSL